MTEAIHFQAVGIFPNANAVGFTAPDIIANCAAEFGVSVDQIRGSRGNATVFRARKEAARRLRELGLSLSRIGELLGGRHHTSIGHALRDL